MTSREAYVFGWVFGRIRSEDSKDAIGGDVALAAQRPYSANARIIADAHRTGILTSELDHQIGEALCEISSIEPPMEGGSEKFQPLELQGSWQLGYYTGRGKLPLSPSGFDIPAARKAKKMTQAQLAEQMDVDQALVSRWESGKVSPNKENLTRLREILL